MAKKITIIGGSGFVGTYLCRALALKQQDFEILDLNMSREFPEKCKIADVRDIQSLRATITGDVVINLAAVHRDDVRDKSEYQRTNVDGASNVAAVCEALGINKIIFTSSVAVYGFAEPGTDEGGKINPFNEYGRTKFAAEEKLREWQSRGDNELIIVRPTVIFGEGNRGNVYNLLKQIATDKFIMVGKGKNRKSMAYIGNVVAFLESCIEQKINYEVYNYVDSPDMEMQQLVSFVRSTLHNKSGVGPKIPLFFGLIMGYIADGISFIFKKKLPLSYIRVKKFSTSTELTSSKVKSINFVAPYTLEEGLGRTLHSEFINPNIKQIEYFTE